MNASDSGLLKKIACWLIKQATYMFEPPKKKLGNNFQNLTQVLSNTRCRTGNK